MDCTKCATQMATVQYGYYYDATDPMLMHHYDGVSEYGCTNCGLRIGRWSKKVLDDGQFEPRFGEVYTGAIDKSK